MRHAGRQPHFSRVGLAWALALLTAWAVSLIVSLLWPLDGSESSTALQLLMILLRTSLQTGLFIIAHDAMHGSLLPGAPAWNDRIGRLALWLYACLPWEACQRNHRRHHQAPVSRIDPDHHDVGQYGPLQWYTRFMASYLTAAQMANLLGAWVLALLLLHPLTTRPLASLSLFWILPLLLSSVQLFVVGTYLPHRDGPARSGDRHRAASLAWPEPFSFLACFHFGYHWEHHHNPSLPWFRLPMERRLMTDSQPGRDRLALSRF